MGYQWVECNEVVVISVPGLEEEEQDGFSGGLLSEVMVLIRLYKLCLDEINRRWERLHPEGLLCGCRDIMGMPRDTSQDRGWTFLTCCVQDCTRDAEEFRIVLH